MNSAGALIDSNVILDVLTEDERWGTWSQEAMARAADRGPLVINAVVYAETSVRFRRVEQLDEVLPSDVFHRQPIPFSAAFLAAKAYEAYRRRGGARRSPLPDFFIGAHAAVAGLTLVTRDPRRYREYFPAVDLVSPST